MKLWVNLRERLQNPGPDIWYDPKFMAVIEQHLSIIKKEKSETLSLDPAKAETFVSDFFGLLKSLGVAPQYWYATLRLSGLKSPTDFTPGTLVIRIPDFQYLETLRQQYQTIHRI